MVDVEDRPLCTLEEHVLAIVDVVGEEGPGVDGHVLLGEALAETRILVVERVDIERLARLDAENLLGERALLRDDVFEAFAQHVGVEQVADPDAAPASLVLVGRADAATGGGDVEVALAFDVLLNAVENAMIGKMTCARRATRTSGSTPRSCSASSSSNSVSGLTTQPLPNTFVVPRMAPLGTSESLYSSPSWTTVRPALSPP